MENIFFYSLVFLFALFWGSFSNVVIFRLHSEESGIFGGRSHCQSCNHQLNFWDLFPVFSWLFLRGKCRYCKTKISWQYPLVEFAMATLWVLLLWGNGIGLQEILFEGKIWEALFWVIFGFFWMVMFVADVRWMEVFRYITIPTIALIIAGLIFFQKISWQDAALGACIPTLFFGAQIVISKYIYTAKGDWIGEGDLDFGIIMGLLLGWKITIVALFLSYIIGAFVGVFVMRIKGRDAQIAFGPFLLSSLLICLFYGQEILDWYMGILFPTL